MRIKCDKVDIDSSKGILYIKIKGFDYFLFYMKNTKEDIEKLLNEIPLEELEEYILKRKSED